MIFVRKIGRSWDVHRSPSHDVLSSSSSRSEAVGKMEFVDVVVRPKVRSPLFDTLSNLATLLARVYLLATLRVPTTLLALTRTRSFFLPTTFPQTHRPPSSLRSYSVQTTTSTTMSNSTPDQDKWKIAIVGTSLSSSCPTFSPTRFSSGERALTGRRNLAVDGAQAAVTGARLSPGWSARTSRSAVTASTPRSRCGASRRTCALFPNLRACAEQTRLTYDLSRSSRVARSPKSSTRRTRTRSTSPVLTSETTLLLSPTSSKLSREPTPSSLSFPIRFVLFSPSLRFLFLIPSPTVHHQDLPATRGSRTERDAGYLAHQGSRGQEQGDPHLLGSHQGAPRNRVRRPLRRQHRQRGRQGLVL